MPHCHSSETLPIIYSKAQISNSMWKPYHSHQTQADLVHIQFFFLSVIKSLNNRTNFVLHIYSLCIDMNLKWNPFSAGKLLWNWAKLTSFLGLILSFWTVAFKQMISLGKENKNNNGYTWWKNQTWANYLSSLKTIRSGEVLPSHLLLH